MTLTGDEKALTPARFGVARFGATRFGYAPEAIQVTAGNPLSSFSVDATDEQKISTTWTEEDLVP